MIWNLRFTVFNLPLILQVSSSSVPQGPLPEFSSKDKAYLRHSAFAEKTVTLTLALHHSYQKLEFYSSNIQ